MKLHLSPSVAMAEKWFFDNYVELEEYIPDHRTRMEASKLFTKRQIYFLIDHLRSDPSNEKAIKELSLILKQLRKYKFKLTGE